LFNVMRAYSAMKTARRTPFLRRSRRFEVDDEHHRGRARAAIVVRDHLGARGSRPRSFHAFILRALDRAFATFTDQKKRQPCEFIDARDR
jgi:hypothetical protein